MEKKRAARYPEIFLDDQNTQEQPQVDSSTEIIYEEAEILTLRTNILRRAMATLTGQITTMIELKLNGFSNVEISEQLQMPANSVASNLFYTYGKFTIRAGIRCRKHKLSSSSTG